MNKSKAILKLEKELGVEISGPFTKFYSPFGVALPHSKREIWYVSRQRTPEEIKKREDEFPEFTKRAKLELSPETYKKYISEITFGEISHWIGCPRRFVIPQLFPVVSFNSLKKTIQYLIKNDGKLIYCS